MQFQCFSPLRKSSFDFKLGDQTAERFVVLLDTLAAGADKMDSLVLHLQELF
jgi:hypothetical protein